MQPSALRAVADGTAFGVSTSLLSEGSPDEVYAYVRKLVRDVGPTGLILCPGCDAPLNSKPEDMQAFVAACTDS